MRINKTIINAAAKVMRTNAKRADIQAVSCPIIKTGTAEVTIKDAPLLRTPLSKKQILNMKPSEFQELLKSRTDIPKSIVEKIYGPEDIQLYDNLNNYFLIKNYSQKDRIKLLENVFNRHKWFDYGYINCIDTKSVGESIPRLIEKGFDPQLVTQLKIDNLNKNFVEEVLSKKDFIKQASEKIENSTQEEAYIQIINNILSAVDAKNIKYIEECYRHTGDILFRPLHYWQKDTGKIFLKYLKNLKDHELEIALDRLYRNKHDINSVQKIFGESEITPVMGKLLEFKDFDKYKNIDIASFEKLSTKDKKEFLRCFTQALTPYDVKWPSQNGGFGNYHRLSEKMKIFKELNYSDEKEFAKSYHDLLEKMLISIPKEERSTIKSHVNYGNYLSEYRKANPYPSMFDDISALKTKKEVFNGKAYEVVELPVDTNIGIATHRIPDGASILNIQALEICNPEALLCIGKKCGDSLLNFYRSGYALAVKPRLSNDWWIQAATDIDTGTGATKNIRHIERFTLRSGRGRDFKLIPENIKKELNLSQNEYTKRIRAVENCSTLNEIEKVDSELATALRKINQKVHTSEGLMRHETMGILIDADKPLENLDRRILGYIDSHNLKIIRVLRPKPKEKPDMKNFTFKIEL